jgi:hypothetical protein
MDRMMRLQHLAQAEAHIARGAQHISDQEMRIADLDLHGHDSALARSLMETFLLTQAQHVAHRDRILVALAE